jgi:type II secretory pathway component PulJ
VTRLLRRRSEAGFTVVEVTIASALLLAVLTIVSGVLVSLTNSENRSQALVNNQEAVRVGLLRMARDLRSAASLNPLSAATGYPYEVQINALDGSLYRWRLDTTTSSVKREKYVSGAWQTAGAALINVTNQTTGVPVFRYYRAASNLELDPATSTASDIANCAIRVHVTITAASNPGPKPFTSEYDVHLRNRLPAGIPGC